MPKLKRDLYSFRLFSGKNDKQENERTVDNKIFKLININHIDANANQPRTHFEEEKLQELAVSIEQNGLLQPIVVRPYAGRYQIVMGERRFRACKLAGLKEVPCIVQTMDDNQTAAAALVENIQREDLSPIEEALAYQQIIELQSITQSELAEKVGKTQSTIANKIRLLQLPNQVQDALLKKQITERHARALLRLKNEELQIKVLEEILTKNMTVDQTDKRVKTLLEGKKEKVRRKTFSRHVKIALNTISQAVKMVCQSGTDAKEEVTETDEEVIITIKVKK